uniref:Uncharacterized protein n=1 Tax=Arcella intermedia TaxID=1963864 RepID=A0A6B2LMA1_9EUKA
MLGFPLLYPRELPLEKVRRGQLESFLNVRLGAGAVANVHVGVAAPVEEPGVVRVELKGLCAELDDPVVIRLGVIEEALGKVALAGTHDLVDLGSLVFCGFLSWGVAGDWGGACDACQALHSEDGAVVHLLGLLPVSADELIGSVLLLEG